MGSENTKTSPSATTSLRARALSSLTRDSPPPSLARSRQCGCDFGWTGPGCERHCPFGCSGHGVCGDKGCECYAGWQGDGYCDSECDNSDCSWDSKNGVDDCDSRRLQTQEGSGSFPEIVRERRRLSSTSCQATCALWGYNYYGRWETHKHTCEYWVSDARRSW